MQCLAEIDCGAARARAELLFLAELLFQLGHSINPRTDISGPLGFSDVFRCPACRTGDYIQLSKISVTCEKDLAALRLRALEGVRHVIEIINRHGLLPSGPISASPSVSGASDSSCASARTAEPEISNPA